VIEIHPLEGIPEIAEGDDLAALFVDAATPAGGFREGDVLVVTQKVISKTEGRTLPSTEKRAAVEAESVRVLRRQGEMLISETRHGFVCANAGVDESNIPTGQIALLPIDPDASARRVRSRLQHLTGLDVAVIISDTFGRAWRLGQTDVAIGVAGLLPFADYVGTEDTEGRIMMATRICVADELAGAAELVMGKTERVCAAIVRGAPAQRGRAAATDIVRPADQDLFR
jgi:coenzyme F420-0:L-glutamate ligase/coenzyme F420-1:gamma-L-glutamate ligase